MWGTMKRPLCLRRGEAAFLPLLRPPSDCLFISFSVIQDCVGGRECYFSHDPKIYEHMRNIMGCWFLHTDRSKLPALIFDPEWYNVAIHVRLGDREIETFRPSRASTISFHLFTNHFSSCELVTWCCVTVTKARFFSRN